MKNSKRLFILIEAVLAAMVIVLAFVMLQEKNGRDLDKVSVIIQNSDDNQWSAFKYGLRMAAEDRKIEMFVVSTGGTLTAEEEKSLIEREIENGADAVIVQPAPDADTENMLRDGCGKESSCHAGRVYSVKGKRGLRPAGHRAGPLCHGHGPGGGTAERLQRKYRR